MNRLILSVLIFATAALAEDAVPDTLEKPTKKHPAIAAALSFYVAPGAGQIYNGEYRKAAYHFGAMAGGLGLFAAGLDAGLTDTKPELMVPRCLPFSPDHGAW